MKDYQKLFAVREKNISAVFVQGLYSGFAENERA